jgi:hypothetical protein
VYFAHAGDDRIDASNGVKETVRCGSGTDIALVDANDETHRCEQTKRR